MLKDELVVASDPNEEPEEEEDEEDLIDPQDTLKDDCKSHCTKFEEELARCTERVSSKSETEETCVQELFDFVHCVDHCVSKKLFTSLK